MVILHQTILGQMNMLPFFLANKTFRTSAILNVRNPQCAILRLDTHHTIFKRTRNQLYCCPARLIICACLPSYFRFNRNYPLTSRQMHGEREQPHNDYICTSHTIRFTTCTFEPRTLARGTASARHRRVQRMALNGR